MTLLTTYQDFISRVEQLGFMALSNILPGFPSLSAETPEELWHTGLETDPWCWKNRAAQEERLAYGCILGGHKGSVAPRMYSIFFRAYHPIENMPERWSAGKVKQTTWQLWQFFQERGSLNTSQARKLLGPASAKSASQINVAIQDLQREYYITVSGNEQKVSSDGNLYGWPSNVYTRVVDWAPSEWLETVNEWSPEEAKALILDEAAGLSQLTDRKAIQLAFRLT
jgi:hypothetical protein